MWESNQNIQEIFLYWGLANNYFAVNIKQSDAPLLGLIVQLPSSFERFNKLCDLGSACISVDLLNIQLQLHDDVCSAVYFLIRVNFKIGLLDYVCFIGDFAIYWGSLYQGSVLYIFLFLWLG